VLECLIADDCWAWTDDPDWAKKVKEAVEKYKEMSGGLAE